MNSTDVFVIGGGPAGLAAAIAARLLGLRVMVADGATPPIDKACGEALMPDAIATLQQLKVRMPAEHVFPLGGVRFLASGISAEANFPSGCSGMAIRRTLLHEALIARAEELGVTMLWQTVVTGISGEQVILGNRRMRAKWIIGADGIHSRVRRWAGLDGQSRSPIRYAFLRHYRVAPWSDRMEIYWAKDSQAYSTGVSGEEVCVAVASRDPQMRLEKSLCSFPDLETRLRGAVATSAERGSASANRKLRSVCKENIALIGDASGTVDAITGQGLGLSFAQTVALARCIGSGNLRSYEAVHRRLLRRPLGMARLMLTLDGRPRFQRKTLEVFRRHPEIFRRFLALHVGNLSPADLALDGLALGWGLLSA